MRIEQPKNAKKTAAPHLCRRRGGRRSSPRALEWARDGSRSEAIRRACVRSVRDRRRVNAGAGGDSPEALIRDPSRHAQIDGLGSRSSPVARLAIQAFGTATTATPETAVVRGVERPRTRPVYQRGGRSTDRRRSWLANEGLSQLGSGLRGAAEERCLCVIAWWMVRTGGL